MAREAWQELLLAPDPLQAIARVDGNGHRRHDCGWCGCSGGHGVGVGFGFGCSLEVSGVGDEDCRPDERQEPLPDRAAFYVDKSRPETLKQMQHMGGDLFFRDYPKHPTWVALAEALLGEEAQAQEPECQPAGPVAGYASYKGAYGLRGSAADWAYIRETARWTALLRRR